MGLGRGIFGDTEKEPILLELQRIKKVEVRGGRRWDRGVNERRGGVAQLVVPALPS